jgi:hypothetical protein
MRSHCLALVVAVFSICSASSFAQVGADPRVPLRDGLYFNSADMCVGFKKGEVDFAAYDVDKGGRLISGPGNACVVASIKTIRRNRYLVVTDCREIDEVSQQTFILDAPSREKFRMEGEEYTWCVGPPEAAAQKPPKPSTPLANALQKLSNNALIDYWADQNEGCRGAAGDDPQTGRACGRRTDAADELERRGLCYKAARGQMDWVRCR